MARNQQNSKDQLWVLKVYLLSESDQQLSEEQLWTDRRTQVRLTSKKKNSLWKWTEAVRQELICIVLSPSDSDSDELSCQRGYFCTSLYEYD